ncbi:hypothetical protein [Bartonella sp. B1099]|uniref:hypothetical protein n=1 Tax=Bartonella sp. B1099 TaxID=2911422 RepID=UPI0020C473B7|nr:hypothetical protein [Bartonella sp. B1099]
MAKSIALWRLPICFVGFLRVLACQWVWLLLRPSKAAALLFGCLCGKGCSCRGAVGQGVCVTREEAVACGCCVPLRGKDKACGAWAVMMRAVWGMVMRFMVAALPVV